jgi:hypothetical protein
MKKFIILASLGIAVFSLAPYHTVAVPISPTKASKALNPDEPLGGGIIPPPPVLILPPPPPPPIIIVLPPPNPIPVPQPPPPPPPPPPAPTTGVPETGATWLLLLLGLAGAFGTLLIQQQSKKSSHRDS